MRTTPENSCRISNLSLSNIIHSSAKKSSPKTILKKIHKLFNKKYAKLALSYNTNIIDNIIYNEKSHIVATFKDRLITDDTGEFLKRYYKKNESDTRLPKFYEYYDLYSKIFPNYTAFNEGKYLYQNIQKKQRMIDLQEKMELEAKQNKEKSDTSSMYSESKENVFNTDAIDSILNGTNNEGIEILFDINKNNINLEEDIFFKDVDNLIEEINNYETKKKKIDNNHNLIKNKIMKNNNFNNNSNNNNINNNRNEVNKDSNLWNKNISVPINLNYTKNKRISNSNSTSTINNTNITYYSNIQSIISKFFNIPSYQKNNFLNFNNNHNKNGKMNNSKNKNIYKKDKTLVEKLEKNLFKMRQKSIFFQKNLSQNISTSNQTQKDISLSKKNSSIYTKKPSTSTSSHHNPKTQRNKIINSSTYKAGNNFIHNIGTAQKEVSPLTSRNPHHHSNKIGIDLSKTKKVKNVKGNIYYISDAISRNKYANNINLHNKAKSSIRGSIYNRIVNKMKESQNSSSKNKKIMNKTKNQNSKTKPKKEFGYKEISFIKNKNSRNKNDIKEKIINSRFNVNSSRNYNNRTQYKNKSQTKTIVNKKKNNFNDSSLKLGILDILNIKKNIIKGFNINNFSKVINGSNINSKNAFSKTHRNNFYYK